MSECKICARRIDEYESLCEDCQLELSEGKIEEEYYDVILHIDRVRLI